MILVIANWEKKYHNVIVSHGVNMDTGENIVLPQVPIEKLDGARWNNQMQEYILED